MRAPHRFSLSLTGNDGNPAIMLAVFTLPSHEAGEFATTLGIPWPVGDITHPDAHFKKGRLRIDIERVHHGQPRLPNAHHREVKT